MAKSLKDFDPATDEAPSLSSGVDPCDNPGIEPSNGPIKDTPGETAENTTAAESMDKAQPFKCTGSGYTKC